MTNYPHPIIAHESWPFLGVAIVVAVLSIYFIGIWAIPFWLLTLIVPKFLHNPRRAAPIKSNAVLSPADGRIVVVEKAQDPYAGREALKIGVFMNVFQSHTNRAPVDGQIKKVHYFPGKWLTTDLDKASLENERNALIISARNGEAVTCVQVAGLIAHRIFCQVKENDVLKRGQRYGFIRFGSHVDIYLPLNVKPKVAVGDKVFATETVLAEF